MKGLGQNDQEQVRYVLQSAKAYRKALSRAAKALRILKQDVEADLFTERVFGPRPGEADSTLGLTQGALQQAQDWAEQLVSDVERVLEGNED